MGVDGSNLYQSILVVTLLVEDIEIIILRWNGIYDGYFMWEYYNYWDCLKDKKKEEEDEFDFVGSQPKEVLKEQKEEEYSP